MVPLQLPIDRVALQHLGDDGPKVAEMFLLHAPGCLQNLHQGIADREVEPLARAAHALNGMSAYLHATGLRTLCMQMEDAASRGKFTEAEALVALVAKEHDRVVEALRAHYQL